MSGPSCTITCYEDILVSFLCKGAARETTLMSAESRGEKIETVGAINELRGVKGPSLFCLSRLVTSRQFFFSLSLMKLPLPDCFSQVG